ncbi:hypothetical protein IB247_00670 [Pseudomonas sp. PDM08]|nr:hypothetical protein [Pseudomonas sp. PDM08]
MYKSAFAARIGRSPSTITWLKTNGRLVIVIKDANGNEKELEYNDAGQLVKYTDCSGKTSAWEYDERGLMICFTDAAGQSIEYHRKNLSLLRNSLPLVILWA